MLVRYCAVVPLGVINPDPIALLRHGARVVRWCCCCGIAAVCWSKWSDRATVPMRPGAIVRLCLGATAEPWCNGAMAQQQSYGAMVLSCYRALVLLLCDGAIVLDGAVYELNSAMELLR